MNILARVLFQMKARDAHLQGSPLAWVSGLVALGCHNLKLASLRKRLIVLRDLITLRQVRVKIVLAREDRALVDL